MSELPIETDAAKKKERFKLIGAVYIIMRDQQGSILLSLRKNTGYADGFWGIPAGHLDGKESARQAARREAAEELGIRTSTDDMKIVLTLHRLAPNRECVDFFIEINTWTGTPIINEPDKCAELSFFNVEKLPENLIPQEKYALSLISKGETYGEYGFNNSN